jgi:hypothetical protein
MAGMGDDGASELKRVRLRGARFEGGRLPIASLVELQKYQHIIEIAAAAEWRRKHPGEELPVDFAQGLALTIERIEEGSADVFLAYEQQQTYVHYQSEAQEAADSFLVAAYSDSPLPSLPALDRAGDELFRNALALFGSSLESDQSIEFYPGSPDSMPVVISQETRGAAIERLSRIEDFLLVDEHAAESGGLRKAQESVVGHVTAIDADRKRFDVVLEDGAHLHGFYKSDLLLEDFRAVVHEAAKGPLTRIQGDLQTRNGTVWRFWHATSIEQVQFDDTGWGRRLTEFAGLRPGWDGHDAAQISSVALDGAQAVLRQVEQAGLDRPGVFPTEDGGVLAEWVSKSGVLSFEVDPEGAFEMFRLRQGEQGGEHAAATSAVDAFRFIEGAQP